MKTLILGLFLIASICAFHIKKRDFNVVIDKIEYSNFPTNKYEFKNSVLMAPVTEILKKAVENLKEPRAGIEANLNDYADKVFVNLQNLLIHDGYDPVELPDMHSGFNYTLIITYYGDLYLTQGWMSDLSTIHRGGDVVVTYSTDDKYLELTLPIAFNDLQFSYDYSATIMGLGPNGGIDGKVEALTVEVKLGFDAVNLVASLDEFYITDSGQITFEFTGNALIDWLLNLLTDVVTTLLKEVILLVVENVVRGVFQNLVDDINDAIGAFINPTTPAPGVTSAALFLK